MKIKIILILLTILSTFSIFAQSNYYYYYKGEKVYLNLDKKSVYINTTNSFQKTAITNSNVLDFDLKINETLNKWSVLNFQNEPSNLEYYQNINSFKNINTVNVVSPCFTTMNGDKFAASNEFYVKLKNTNDFSLLEQKVTEYGVIIKNQNQFMPLWYTLSLTKNSIDNVLNIANIFYETNLFSSSFPNLFSTKKVILENENLQTTPSDVQTNCVNDNYFSRQWNLENTGQLISSNPPILATAGIDINACNAWNITTGNNDITIAVIDRGIDLNHPDLTNLYPLSFDTVSNTSPSQIQGGHGTTVAGVIGATQNNINGLSGVSPDCKLMSVSTNWLNLENLANGINWSWLNGADVINNSWYLLVLENDLIDQAFNNALSLGRDGKGCVVVFASGNDEGIIDLYPVNSNDDFIVVGAISPCAERRSPNSCDSDGNPLKGSAYGQELDVVAPGVFIPTTVLQLNNDPYILNWGGTSAAAPHVAGIAGLILSVNPNLTNLQVNDIIENTAQKIGNYSYQTHPNRANGTWNEEMGYGLVDAYAAVNLAVNPNGIDLYTKNSSLDYGETPDTNSIYSFISPDIWVRHQQDGLTNFENQNPESDTTNYVYVRVRNRGNITSIGDEVLHLYWSNGFTQWPSGWNGTPIPLYPPHPNNYYVTGNEVGSLIIPSIPPNEEIILEFTMNFSSYFYDPYVPTTFKLLSRIVSDTDIILNETDNIHYNILNNNNIASKKVTAWSSNSASKINSVAISNNANTSKAYRLEFNINTNEIGKAIYNEAEVNIEFDQELFDAWVLGGKQGSNFKTTANEKILIATNNNVILNNIILQAKQFCFFNTSFHFLTKEFSDKTKFNYYITQYDANTNELIDGTQFKINKKNRTLFNANAGNDKEVDENENITINAEDINELAIYNWYDLDGNLIYQGKDFTVSTEITKKYKLEIIADIDGFKDYDEIELKLKPSSITTISPNPSSTNITINYKLNGVSSAYLMIIGTNNGTSHNYILDINSEQVNVNISNYSQGYYTVALVCNGQISDAKTIFKN